MFLDNIYETQNRYYYKASSRRKQNSSSVFAIKKVLLHKNLNCNSEAHNYINYGQFALCPMKIHHTVLEKGYDKLFFLKKL